VYHRRRKFRPPGLELTKVQNPSGMARGSFWVKGWLNIEQLPELPQTERNAVAHQEPRKLGNIPAWLQLITFCGEGCKFGVIYDSRKNSLGLVETGKQ